MTGRCSICQERFDPSEISALKCGHTFHFDCISPWVKTGRNCPVCREPAQQTDLIKQLFFDHGEDTMVSFSQSPPANSKRVNDLTKQVEDLETELSKKDEKLKTLEQKAAKASKDIHSLRTRNEALEITVQTLRAELSTLRSVNVRNDTLTLKNKQLEAQLKKLQAIEMLVQDCDENSNTAGKVQDCSAEVLKTSLEIIRKKYKGLAGEKSDAIHRNKTLERNIAALKEENKELFTLLESALEGSGDSKSGQSKFSIPVKPGSSLPRDAVFRSFSTDEVCRVYNLPYVKTTNMAARANIVPKFTLDDDDEPTVVNDTPPLLRAKRRPYAKAGKAKVSSAGKRFDGFGGRTTAFDQPSTSKDVPTTPLGPRKRPAKVLSKGKAKVAKVLTPKIRNADLDDSVVVLSD